MSRKPQLESQKSMGFGVLSFDLRLSRPLWFKGFFQLVNIEGHSDGVVISVRVSPGASRDRVIGEHVGALKVSVSAPPEKGKANKAVCALIAKTLGVAKSSVGVVAGETSRDKKVLVCGVNADYARRMIHKPGTNDE